MPTFGQRSSCVFQTAGSLSSCLQPLCGCSEASPFPECCPRMHYNQGEKALCCLHFLLSDITSGPQPHAMNAVQPTVGNELDTPGFNNVYSPSFHMQTSYITNSIAGLGAWDLIMPPTSSHHPRAYAVTHFLHACVALALETAPFGAIQIQGQVNFTAFSSTLGKCCHPPPQHRW